jgi:uncharacterized C2H2 Zn-finger protein
MNEFLSTLTHQIKRTIAFLPALPASCPCSPSPSRSPPAIIKNNQFVYHQHSRLTTHLLTITRASPQVMEQSFSCPVCSLHFGTQALLNKHTSRSHGPVEERTCPHCAQVFKDKTSLPRHVKLCHKRPAVAIKCVLPASSVPARPSAPDTKARSPKKNYSPVERYLASLTAYLNNGSYMHTFAVRRKSLATNTITGYISSVRKFLETIIDGLISGHGSGTFAPLFLFLSLSLSVVLISNHTPYPLRNIGR